MKTQFDISSGTVIEIPRSGPAIKDAALSAGLPLESQLEPCAITGKCNPIPPDLAPFPLEAFLSVQRYFAL